jgi:hypothetical protein
MDDATNELRAEIERLRVINTELLSALRQIVRVDHFPDSTIARAALAKAKGK